MKSNQRKVIYQTREGVFHLISKHEKECFIWYPNTRRSVLFDIQTRKGVFYVIYQTREGVFHLISKHQEVVNQTREGVFIRYSNTEKECLYDRVVKWWRSYHGWRITFASVDFWHVYHEFILSTKNCTLSKVQSLNLAQVQNFQNFSIKYLSESFLICSFVFRFSKASFNALTTSFI